MRSGGAILCVLLAAGCAVPPPRAARAPAQAAWAPPARSIAPRGTMVEWPSALLAGADGPALFRHRGGDEGFAWIAVGTPLSVRGAVRDGRVKAYVDGPVRVRGWIDVDELEAIVLARGRVRGTPLYVVPGDRVRLVRAEGAMAEVEASAHLAHPQQPRSPAFRGAYPLARLGADLQGSGRGPTPGRPVVLRRSTALFDRPGGEAVWTLPAFDPPLPAIVLREEGGHLGVRIGAGPYLVGYVQRSALEPDGASHKQVHPEVLDPWAPSRSRTPAQPTVQDPWAEAGELSDEPNPEPLLPPRLQRAVVRPVWRLRAGARVRVDGATMAIFRQEGHAVELERAGSRVEVLAAVDESVTVRGTVAASDLLSFEPSATPDS